MAFHIHVPKPLHGWKAFFNEIAVIVLGVVIALGLEQVVEWVHWRHKVSEGEKLLQTEAVRNIGAAAEFFAVAPCIDAQVDSIRRNLAATANRQPLQRNDIRVERTVVVTPQRPSYTASWQALSNDGTLNHMAPARFNAWSSLYDSAERESVVGNAGFDRSREFDVLAEPVEIPAPSAFTLLTHADEFQQIMSRARRVGVRSFEFYQKLGLEIPEERIEKFVLGSRTVQFCKTHGLPVDDWRNAYRQKMDPLSL